MNNLKIACGMLRAALWVGALILVACSNPADSSSLSGPDTGAVRIIIVGQGGARTVLPGMASFVKYTVNFVREDGVSEPLLIVDAESPVTNVELKPGKWTVIIGGWVAADIFTGDEEYAPEGEAILTDLVNTAMGSTKVTVQAGQTANAVLMLNKKLDETEGSGDLIWDVSFPAALVETAQLTLSRLEGAGGFILRKTIDLTGGARPGQYRGSETLSAGYYRVDVTLAAAHFTKGRTVVAYIYPRMETQLPSIVFNASDIPAPNPGTEAETGSIAVTVGVNEDATMNITYTPPHREGESVILSATGEAGYPTELTVSVVDFSDVLCLIDSVEIDHVNGNAGRFVIRAAELEEGSHYLTVIGINGEATVQSVELPFTVIAPSSGQPPAIIEADSVAALAAALDALPVNTAATAYAVKLSGIKINSNYTTGETLRTMYDALSRYVTLDLRDCIGNNFINCNPSLALGKAYVVAVRLGESVMTIALSSFSGCTSLVKAEFPGVDTIGANALVNCAALEEITLGSAPPTLGASALPEGPTFAAIFVPNGAAQAYQSKTVDDGWTAELKALVQEISNE